MRGRPSASPAFPGRVGCSERFSCKRAIDLSCGAGPRAGATSTCPAGRPPLPLVVSLEGSRLSSTTTSATASTLTRNAPRGLALREAGRHLLITGSYARRDILVPLVRRRPLSVETVQRRMRAYGDYVRLLPEALAGRRQLAARGRMTDEELARWMAQP